MYCKHCGHDNEDDAQFCENCGADLDSTPSSDSPSRIGRTNKILIVVVIVLVLGIGITAGMLLTDKSSSPNTISNKKPAEVSNSKSSSDESEGSAGPELIDSGSMNGINAKYDNGPFTYDWETYQIDEGNLVVYGTYTTTGKSIKQTVTLKKYGSQSVEITAEPKSSGKSSWRTVTSLQGYPTVEDYYWGIFRPGREEAGPVS